MAKSQQNNKKKQSKRGREIHKANLEKKIKSIEDDLNDPKTIYFLGQEPIYIHSTKKNAEFGLKVVTTHIQNTLNRRVTEVKQELQHWSGQLQAQENILYQQIAPFSTGQNGITYLQSWYKQLITNNPNMSFNDFANAFFTLKDVAFNFRALGKDNKEAGTPEIQRIADESMQGVLSYLQSQSKKIQGKSRQVLKDYAASLGSIITIDNNNEVHVDLNKISNIQSTLGLTYEWVIEQGSKYLQNEFGGKLVRYAEELVGKKDQAASDLKLTIGSVSVGLSAKLRKLNTREGKDWVIRKRYGANAQGSSVENYFNNNSNSSFNLSQEEIYQINYAIANWKAFSPIGNSSELQETLMQLMAWNKVVFGFLGTDYKTATLPPVFLVSFDEIIPMRWMLNYIISLSNNDILTIINKTTGSWQTKSVLKGDAANNLYKSKKTALRRMNRQKQQITYNALKKQIIPQLSILGIKIGSISIKYKILVENFSQLAVYN